MNSWPAGGAHRLYLGWNYWWQAHLLDCLVDAEIRQPAGSPPPARPPVDPRHPAGERRRWINSYYDDMAWLALALQRADRHAGTSSNRPVRLLTGEIERGLVGVRGRRHPVATR